MIWIERFYYLHNQAANRKASQRVTLLTHPPTQQCKVKFSLSHPLFGHPLNFPMFLLTLFLSIFKDSFAAIARAKSKISANSQGNHVNNIGQLVELGDHLPLPPPLLLLLHQGPRLAGPAFAFESWNQSETFLISMEASATSASTTMVATWSFIQAQRRGVFESSAVTASGSTLINFYKLKIESLTHAGAKGSHNEFGQSKPTTGAGCSFVWSGWPPARIIFPMYSRFHR